MMTIVDWLPTIFSAICALITGLVGWGYRSDRTALANLIEKNSADIRRVDQRCADQESAFNDLKADLPMVYVLREDNIRTMNSVETNIRDMTGKIDRLLEYSLKGGKADG